jgi:APA family basic amino acid/polyamine antiporter
MIMLVALGVVVLFMATNAFVGKANKKFSEITSPIKFIPLLLVISLGIVFGIMHSQHNLFSSPGAVYSKDQQNMSGAFDINGVFMSLPPILFALDSFLVVGNIAGDVKNPEKNVPLSILLSMILSGAVYLFVTIGQIFTGCGNAYNLIEFIFTNGNGGDITANLKVYATICDAVISIFILIAILGVVNSLSMGCVSSANASIDESIIIGSHNLIRFAKGRANLPGFLAAGTMTVFYWVALGLPSMIMNTDQFMDGASNLAVIFYFSIYGLVAIFSAVNRKTHKVNDITKSKGQVPMALIGGIGCLIVTVYAMVYTYFANVVMNPTDINTS